MDDQAPNEEAERTRKVQQQTCICCRLHWGNPLVLRSHLEQQKVAIDKQLAGLPTK